ncbi:unnamed protein product [Symbiodinium natans]|uniref:Uncharacterized protein n=1 Tax=Symbiodinium natans TaxID=878477 RepID=A0A812J8L3_9DINO|nr:unnamed protein product [Symbiodinium natans]
MRLQSVYIFYDEQGRAHEVRQGEGGEQGDPLMPCLFALGQHRRVPSIAPRASSATFGKPSHATRTSRCVWARRVRGTPQVKNHQGCSPSSPPRTLPTPVGPEVGRSQKPSRAWCIGSREFVAEKLAQRLRKQDCLLQQLPHVPHLQSTWLLLLYYLVRTVPPSDTADFAAKHDAA